MTYLHLILAFSQLSLSAQDSLVVGDTIFVMRDFTIPLDVFGATLSQGTTNQGGLHSDLWEHYFIHAEEFGEIKNIYYATEFIYINAFFEQDIDFAEKYIYRGGVQCFLYICYAQYKYSRKPKRFWKRINKKHASFKIGFDNKLSYVDLHCKFKCVYLGKHKIRTVNSLAKNREQAYTKSLANVYAIIAIHKVVPIPHKKD